jgi:uncharacterized glyoxalase superfamily protein PhnB
MTPSPTVRPRLFTSDVKGLVHFIRIALGGEGEIRDGGPAEMRIGDSVIMVSDGGDAVRQHGGGFLYVYVPDVDAAYNAALNLGAVSLEAPKDQFYGDRRATVKDRWGNSWQIATPQRL